MKKEIVKNENENKERPLLNLDYIPRDRDKIIKLINKKIKEKTVFLFENKKRYSYIYSHPVLLNNEHNLIRVLDQFRDLWNAHYSKFSKLNNLKVEFHFSTQFDYNYDRIKISLYLKEIKKWIITIMEYNNYPVASELKYNPDYSEEYPINSDQHLRDIKFEPIKI